MAETASSRAPGSSLRLSRKRTLARGEEEPLAVQFQVFRSMRTPSPFRHLPRWPRRPPLPHPTRPPLPSVGLVLWRLQRARLPPQGRTTLKIKEAFSKDTNHINKCLLICVQADWFSGSPRSRPGRGHPHEKHRVDRVGQTQNTAVVLFALPSGTGH